MRIGNPTFVYLLACSVAALLLVVGADVGRTRAVSKFASAAMRGSILSTRSFAIRWLAPLFVVVCSVFLVLSLVDIRWGRTTRDVPQKGIEVMFALDVSRSMLADDASPNRLRRAKQQIKDIVDEMAGDRIGLIVFAGEAEQAVPLTSHYDDFKQILDSVGPHSVIRGGSRLGDAIQAAADGFIGKTDDHKTIVLFTDGEDQESRPVELSRQLHADDGVRIFTVGLGDVEQGSRIPNDDSRRGKFVVHEGQQVWSRLNGQVLRSIATETDGAYIPAGTKRVDMADVYHGYIANAERSEFESVRINSYIPRFQWFAGAALVFLLMDLWMTTRSVDETGQDDPSESPRQADIEEIGIETTGSGSRAGALAGAASLLICLLMPTPVEAEPDSAMPIQARINAATRLLKNKQYADAINAYNDIEDAAQHRDELNYNSAIANYRNGDLAEAEALFSKAATSPKSRLAADSRFNLGNVRYSQAIELAQEDVTAALGKLASAVKNYRGSLRIDPDNADARANIELAGQLMRQLQQKQNQQQQQSSPDEQQPPEHQEGEEGQSSDQQQEPSSDGEQKSDEQRESPGKSGDNENDQDSQGDPAAENRRQSSGEPSSNEEEQSQSGQETQESPSEPGDPSSQSPQPNEHELKEDSVANGDSPASAAGPDQPTDGELTSVNANKDAAADDKAPSVGVTDLADGAMTKEEALKMLQSIRDRDMLRRIRRQQRERIRRIPVEKDW